LRDRGRNSGRDGGTIGDEAVYILTYLWICTLQILRPYRERKGLREGHKKDKTEDGIEGGTEDESGGGYTYLICLEREAKTIFVIILPSAVII
jgi:hypothetical protein